ncbi:MAG TPA: hypothetical protein VI959_04395 [Alphaproteobacteria bacterium]|nr:hypothetical protein [Alphaproteobacteria bacterium]
MYKKTLTFFLSTALTTISLTNTSYAMLSSNSSQSSSGSGHSSSQSDKKDMFNIKNFGFLEEDVLEKYSTQESCSDKECIKHNDLNCQEPECEYYQFNPKVGRGGHCCTNIYGTRWIREKNIDLLLGVEKVKNLNSSLKRSWEKFSQEEQKEFVMNALNRLISQLTWVLEGKVYVNNHRLLERAIVLPAFLTVNLYVQSLPDELEDSRELKDSFNKKFIENFLSFSALFKDIDTREMFYAGEFTEEKLLEFQKKRYSYGKSTGTIGVYDLKTTKGQDVCNYIEEMLGWLNDTLETKFNESASIQGIADKDLGLERPLRLIREKKIKKHDEETQNFIDKYDEIAELIKDKKGKDAQLKVEALNSWLNDESLIKKSKEAKGTSTLYEEAVKRKTFKTGENPENLTVSQNTAIKNLDDMMSKWLKKIVGDKGNVAENIKKQEITEKNVDPSEDFTFEAVKTYNESSSKVEEYFVKVWEMTDKKAFEKSKENFISWLYDSTQTASKTKGKEEFIEVLEGLLESAKNAPSKNFIIKDLQNNLLNGVSEFLNKLKKTLPQKKQNTEDEKAPLGTKKDWKKEDDALQDKKISDRIESKVPPKKLVNPFEKSKTDNEDDASSSQAKQKPGSLKGRFLSQDANDVTDKDSQDKPKPRGSVAGRFDPKPSSSGSSENKDDKKVGSLKKSFLPKDDSNDNNSATQSTKPLGQKTGKKDLSVSTGDDKVIIPTNQIDTPEKSINDGQNASSFEQNDSFQNTDLVQNIEEKIDNTIKSLKEKIEKSKRNEVIEELNSLILLIKKEGALTSDQTIKNFINEIEENGTAEQFSGKLYSKWEDLKDKMGM